MIAPLGDLQVGGIRRSGKDSRIFMAVKIGGQSSILRLYALSGFLQAAGFDNVLQLVQSDNRIDLRQFLHDLVPVPFDQAPGGNEAPALPLGFERRHFKDGIDGFFLGRVNESAGIHDDYVRLGRIIGYLVSGLVQTSQHDLGINKVFGTSQADESNLLHDGLIIQVNTFPGVGQASVRKSEISAVPSAIQLPTSDTFLLNFFLIFFVFYTSPGVLSDMDLMRGWKFEVGYEMFNV